MKQIVVIGAGASGLMAAIFAAKNGNFVTILEKNSICGKKILSTGNGRCNFWNEDQNLKHFRSSNHDIIKNIITEENRNNILNFFKNIGIEPKIKNGYYYPFSNQAISIQNALTIEAEKSNVKIITDIEVLSVKKENESFIISTNMGERYADTVIISTGSKAAPKTGSDGLGYRICKNFKHTILKPLPALVQLKANETFLKQWDGVRTEVLIKLCENNEIKAEEKGEIQLTNYGISGICVFNLSGRIARGLDKGKKEEVKINFLSGLNINTVEEFIQWMSARNTKIENRTILELLEGILNYKLVNVLLKKSTIHRDDEWDKISDYQKELLGNNLVDFTLNIVGTNSFDKAQVCSGGVVLEEIDVNTMESKKIKDLYIVGEILDVDGDCGGYNLEWAWITGMIAGRSLNDKIKTN